MLAQTLATRLAARGIHYGWVVVAVTFLTAIATSSIMGIPGVLIVPLREEYGWDTASISGALSLRLALFGLVAPFAAALMLRYGLRTVICAALVTMLAGVALATRMTALWHLWATWGLMVGVATGMTAMVLGATVASRWFTARRGLVVGMLGAATATGQLVILPVAAWLAQTYGWRAAIIPSTATGAVVLVLVVLLLRDYPAQVGLPPFGESAVIPPAPRRAASGIALLSLRALRGAARTRMFWVLFGSFFICGLSTNGLVQQHFIPLCHDFGMPEVAAAQVLALMGICDFFGTIGSGWLSDRFDSRRLLFWYYGLRGLSLMWLPFSNFSLPGLTVFAVFFGLDFIATVPPTVKLAGQTFGREQGPLVFGWVFTGHQLGAAVAAIGAGVSRDVLASYLPAFFAAGATCLLASVLVISVRRPVPAPVANPVTA